MGSRSKQKLLEQSFNTGRELLCLLCVSGTLSPILTLDLSASASEMIGSERRAREPGHAISMTGSIFLS